MRGKSSASRSAPMRARRADSVPDARAAVAADDRPLDRGRAAQLGQQRGVHVPRTEPRDRQQRRRQDPPVGDHHENVGGEGAQRRLELWRADLLRLQHWKTQRARRHLHRRLVQRAPAAGGTIGLTDRTAKVGRRGDDLEAGNSEVRRSEEDRARALGHATVYSAPCADASGRCAW
jgi:hypothetical protein